MKPFGTGSSLFYLKNNVGKMVKVTFTLSSAETESAIYKISFGPNKENPESLILESADKTEVIAISSAWNEKCEDLCANTFITLKPQENTESPYTEVLIKI